MRSSTLNNSAAGAVAGLVATIPMTLAMRWMFTQLPRSQRYPLPPRQILTRLAHRAGVHRRLDDDERRYLARTAHFGFGTAAGATYGLFGQRVFPGLLGGVTYGLGVWAASYLGWLPAAGVLPPATQMPPQRNALMIAAHVVWGAAAAAIFQRLRTRRR